MRSDNYLASPPNGVTIAREIFEKWWTYRSMILGNSKSTWMLHMATPLFRWRQSKIYLTSFIVVASRFLMSHVQVPRTRRITWQKTIDKRDSRHPKDYRDHIVWEKLGMKKVSVRWVYSICAHSATSATVRPLRSCIWRWLSAILGSLWIHGYTVTKFGRMTCRPQENVFFRRVK